MNNQHSGLPLPDGWVHTTIGEVCEFEKGKKPKNTGKLSNTRIIPYINIKAFETGNPEEYAESGNYPMCSKYDVLIVWDGARSGLVGSGVSGYIGSTLSKIWSQSTENKYLFYFLKSQYGYINTNTKGVGIPHVDPGILNAIEIPIAPLDQQKLIVAEIEKQFSRLDEAVAALRRIQANLKRYKASVLKAAVEGKLTEQWRKEHPDVEPASELLKRILVERRRKWEEDYVKKYVGAHGHAPKDDSWKKKYKEPASPDTTNLPKLPKGWAWAKVEQLYEIAGGGTPSTNVPEYWNGNIPWITSADIYDVKDIRPRKQVTEKGIENSATNLVPDKSIIVVTRVGLGKVALTKTPLCFSQDSQALINPSSLLFHDYSLYYLSKAVQVFKHEHRGTTIAGVTKKQLAELPFPLPPLYEQRKIVEEIERRLSVAEEIKTAIETNLKRADCLRQSILRKAFSGHLI